eukprot:UC4_evm5s236
MSSWLGSFTKMINVGGTQLAYTEEDEIATYRDLDTGWLMTRGTSKADKAPVTIFSMDSTMVSAERFEAGRNSLKRLKTLRHPNILKFIDSMETDSKIYLVTEAVIPLKEYLDDKEGGNKLGISWGIRQVTCAVELFTENKLFHCNVCLASIFVTPDGDWKLGGCDYMFGVEDGQGDLCLEVMGPSKYMPPEMTNKSPLEMRKALKRHKQYIWASDMWGLGCFIWEVFNGILPNPSKLKGVGSIPKNLLPHWASLLGQEARSRPSPAKFLESCQSTNQYMENTFVSANLFLEELSLKPKDEAQKFFVHLQENLDLFPKTWSIHHILPKLLHAFEFNDPGPSILGPLFKLGKLLSPDEYQKKIVPCVVKLFSSTDRLTRINLLQKLEDFIEFLSEEIVSNQIFPHVANGFGDTVTQMREATMRSMLLLAPKLNEGIIDSQLLKWFAKLQMDEDPSIRTNTTICLCKVSQNFSEATKLRVLAPAFLRATKDTFAPSRVAGLMSLNAVHHIYSPHECATKIMPSLCPMLVDSEKSVRDAAFKLHDSILKRLERASNGEDISLPDLSSDDTAQSGGFWGGIGNAMSAVTSSLTSSTSGAVTKQNNDIKNRIGDLPSKNGKSSGDKEKRELKKDDSDNENNEESDDESDYENEDIEGVTKKVKSSSKSLKLSSLKTKNEDSSSKWDADGFNDITDFEREDAPQKWENESSESDFFTAMGIKERPSKLKISKTKPAFSKLGAKPVKISASKKLKKNSTKNPIGEENDMKEEKQTKKVTKKSTIAKEAPTNDWDDNWGDEHDSLDTGKKTKTKDKQLLEQKRAERKKQQEERRLLREKGKEKKVVKKGLGAVKSRKAD